MRAINIGEVACALVVGALGAFLLWEGRELAVGELRRIGPGFMPRVVGWTLLAISVGLVAEALRMPPLREGIPGRAILLVMAAIGGFAVLIERLGMVPAIVALVVLSALAERPVRPVETLLLAAAVSALGVLLFIQALGLPLDAFAW
jgi:hypothetical protein